MSFKFWSSKYKQNPSLRDIVYGQNSYPGDINYHVGSKSFEAKAIFISFQAS